MFTKILALLKKIIKPTDKNPVYIHAAVGVTGFGPIRKIVRFPDERTALQGFSVLLKTGGAETLGDNVYGLSSERQVELLRSSNVSFEVVI